MAKRLLLGPVLVAPALRYLKCGGQLHDLKFFEDTSMAGSSEHSNATAIKTFEPSVKSILKHSAGTTRKASMHRFQRKKLLDPSIKAQFSTLTIREYPVTIGDNPASFSGISIALDWIFVSEFSMSVDEYEDNREPRRTWREMILSESDRVQRLKHAGFSNAEIVKQTRPINIARVQRRRTNETLHLQRSQEVSEMLTRVSLNFLTLGKKTRREQKYLERCNFNAGKTPAPEDCNSLKLDIYDCEVQAKTLPLHGDCILATCENKKVCSEPKNIVEDSREESNDLPIVHEPKGGLFLTEDAADCHPVCATSTDISNAVTSTKDAADRHAECATELGITKTVTSIEEEADCRLEFATIVDIAQTVTSTEDFDNRHRASASKAVASTEDAPDSDVECATNVDITKTVTSIEDAADRHLECAINVDNPRTVASAEGAADRHPDCAANLAISKNETSNQDASDRHLECATNVDISTTVSDNFSSPSNSPLPRKCELRVKSILKRSKGRLDSSTKAQFSTLTIREYPVTIGDNPASFSGISIALDWIFVSEFSMSVDEYEDNREPRRTWREMILSESDRVQRLKHAGFSNAEIVKQTRPINIARVQRRRTNETLHLQRSQEVSEMLTRVSLNFLTLGKKTRREQKYLERCNFNAGKTPAPEDCNSLKLNI